MKDNTSVLTVITYVVLLSAVSILINDVREFDFQQFKEFQNWANTADKKKVGLPQKMRLSGVIMPLVLGSFFWRGYLIYAFSHFLSILDEINKGHYFSEKNISYFKKIGNIFIAYTINVLVLRFLLASIGKSTFNFFTELKAEFSLLIPCGLAFYLLAEIFKRANELKQDNDLTI